MSRLFKETGESKSWGVEPHMLAMYEGPVRFTHERYVRLLERLGQRCTQVLRDTDTGDVDGMLMAAEHGFVYPGQAASLRSETDHDPKAGGDGISRERQSAYVNAEAITVHLGVAYTAEPPSVRVYDLMDNGGWVPGLGGILVELTRPEA
jgi:hypothetical protein